MAEGMNREQLVKRIKAAKEEVIAEILEKIKAKRG
jgi:hypothetical protein